MIFASDVMLMLRIWQAVALHNVSFIVNSVRWSQACTALLRFAKITVACTDCCVHFKLCNIWFHYCLLYVTKQVTVHFNVALTTALHVKALFAVVQRSTVASYSLSCFVVSLVIRIWMVQGSVEFSWHRFGSVLYVYVWFVLSSDKCNR